MLLVASVLLIAALPRAASGAELRAGDGVRRALRATDRREGLLGRPERQGSAAGAHQHLNCSAEPEVCGPPLNCAERKFDLRYYTSLAYKGHSEAMSWCYSPYRYYGHQCLLGNLLKASKVLYEQQAEMRLLDVDAHYCFAAGHCNNTRLSASTTLAEAEAFCDERYSHDRWTQHVGFSSVMLTKPESSRGAMKFAQLACAMGNFHCDVVYCQENYCREPRYIAAYGRAAWSSM